MNKCFSILQVLNSICTGNISRLEVNRLIELTQSYAFTYLKYRYKNLHKVFLAEDVTLDELAIDSIAQLFERDEGGVFVKLKIAVENWQPPIETEEKALFFLNRMVGKSVEKYVSELLRDSDPFFSKILDSVNYLIQKQNYKKKQILGTTYIVENEDQKKIGCLPENQFINNLPSNLFFDLNNVIPILFDYIKHNTDKERAIPLNALVIKIKKTKAANFNISDRVEFGGEIAVDSIINNALSVAIEKLRDSYYKKEKFSDHEACRIEKALRNISVDIKDGGINPGLHKYFLEQFPELSVTDYAIKYQNMFEYLFKIFKKEIVKQLAGSE